VESHRGLACYVRFFRHDSVWRCRRCLAGMERSMAKRMKAIMISLGLLTLLVVGRVLFGDSVGAGYWPTVLIPLLVVGIIVVIRGRT
jgi:hypothetical protein